MLSRLEQEGNIEGLRDAKTTPLAEGGIYIVDYDIKNSKTVEIC
jgi:hypothetical protein